MTGEPRRIDAHAHIQADTPAGAAAFDELNLKVLNISFGTDPDGAWRREWSQGTEGYARLRAAQPDRYGWVTSFDLPRFADTHWADRVIEGLDRDLAAGASGVKIWKNVGMEVRKPDGSFIQVDDDLYEPVFAHLERRGVTVVMHVAEPIQCWLPLDPENPHHGYFKDNPKWHLYGRPEFPAHATIIAARVRVMDRHPRLRVVGAHLGSQEHDLDGIASLFARFPGYAVDTAARMMDLVRLGREKVRPFFLAWPDRMLFGTDMSTHAPFSVAPADEVEGRLRTFRRWYPEEWGFYDSDGETNVQGWAPRPRMVRGLGLPPEVREAFYRGNVRRMYPGV